MQIPDQFSLMRWLKEGTVALVVDDQGKKTVLKEDLAKAKLLSKFSDAVKAYTRVLRDIIPTHYQYKAYYYHAFVEGQEAGDTLYKFSFDKDYLLKINPKTLAVALFELQSLSTGDFLKNQTIETRKSSWYFTNLEETRVAITEEFDNYFFDSAGQYLRKLGRAIDGNCKKLVNGDLHPENIFTNCLLEAEGKDFVISDWDLLHFNNPGYDLADVYVWSWTNLSWREQFINEFKALWGDKQDELSVYLSFCQVYLSCQMIKHVYLMRETNLSDQAENNAQGLLESSKKLLRKIVK